MVKYNMQTYSIDSCFLIKHLGNPNLFSLDYRATNVLEPSCLVRFAPKSFSNTAIATILAFNKAIEKDCNKHKCL